jgi:vacuolar-type H+-ATPase subunit E/Vma4
MSADDMLIALDADEMREEPVEEYNAAEAYADRLEAQGTKGNKQIRRDSLAKMKKQADKKQQKQQTMWMREERREFTTGVVMGEVDHDIIHTAMDD